MTFYTGDIYATGRIVEEDGSDFWHRAKRKVMAMAFKKEIDQAILSDGELLGFLEKVPVGALVVYNTRPNGVKLQGYKCVIIHEDTTAGWGLCIFFPNCKPEELNDDNLFPDVEAPLF
jgi:hypothetical protein